MKHKFYIRLTECQVIGKKRFVSNIEERSRTPISNAMLKFVPLLPAHSRRCHADRQNLILPLPFQKPLHHHHRMIVGGREFYPSPTPSQRALTTVTKGEWGGGGSWDFK